MNRRTIIASLNKIANELDQNGLFQESSTLTNVMKKLAQEMMPEDAEATFEPMTEVYSLLHGIPITSHVFNKDRNMVAVVPNDHTVQIYAKSGANWNLVHTLKEVDLFHDHF